MWKKLFISILLIIQAFILQAQFQLNPQLGINSTLSTNQPKTGVETIEKRGFSMGIDLRFGKRFYFLPGAHITTSRILYKFTDLLTIEESEILLSSLKLKSMLGFKLINKKSFNFRLSLGPTYDFFILKDDDGNNFLSESDFSSGSFNFDAAVGFDIYFITTEVGYSYGLTSSFNKPTLNSAPKYQKLFICIGFVFGKN